MKNQEEKIIHPVNGFAGLIILIAALIGGFALMLLSAFAFDSMMISGFLFGIALSLGIIIMMAACICFRGLRVVNPNEAIVLSLFGRYMGTVYDSGFYFVNPFASAIYPRKAEDEAAKQAASSPGQLSALKAVPKKISTKIQTFANGSQKVNDSLGNPIEVSAIIVWRVVNATKALLNVDNYSTYLSNQTDSTIRNIARLYPYDIIDDDEQRNDDELTLRGSASRIADEMQAELASRVENAGIEIMDVRLNQIAYAPEIAAAMLQRQQATAIIAARQKIVDGAVSMVEMALDRLKADGVVELDEERKAQMVSNLLVVLCGNKEASPIVNAGSIY
ncbi:MAG: SPFH domain-containing protein [Bullifex sp.]